MATIHIKEIAKILTERGSKDTASDPKEGFFLEIRFDDPTRKHGAVDPEFKNKVITAECSAGSVTIQFNEAGELKSIDLS